MSVHLLKTTQKLPISVDEAWEFLSKPANLQKITPNYINISVHSDDGREEAYPGKILKLKMTPLLGIPIVWHSEITHVKEGEYFIDEMRKGPLAFWHHQHHIKPIEGGVEMTDILHYKVPLGFIGDIGNWLFVNRQMRSMFKYREEVLEQLFGKY